MAQSILERTVGHLERLFDAETVFVARQTMDIYGLLDWLDRACEISTDKSQTVQAKAFVVDALAALKEVAVEQAEIEHYPELADQMAETEPDPEEAALRMLLDVESVAIGKDSLEFKAEGGSTYTAQRSDVDVPTLLEVARQLGWTRFGGNGGMRDSAIWLTAPGIEAPTELSAEDRALAFLAGIKTLEFTRAGWALAVMHSGKKTAWKRARLPEELLLRVATGLGWDCPRQVCKDYTIGRTVQEVTAPRPAAPQAEVEAERPKKAPDGTRLIYQDQIMYMRVTPEHVLYYLEGPEDADAYGRVIQRKLHSTREAAVNWLTAHGWTEKEEGIDTSVLVRS